MIRVSLILQFRFRQIDLIFCAVPSLSQDSSGAFMPREDGFQLYFSAPFWTERHRLHCSQIINESRRLDENNCFISARRFSREKTL